MIETVRNQDIFSIDRGIVLHQTNCAGAMNSGFAKQVRAKYPEAYNVYLAQHRTREGLVLGDITYACIGDYKFIVNANAQYSYGTDRRHTNYEAVAQCCEKVVEMLDIIYFETRIALDVCFPLFGCGLGGGNWNIVSAIIDNIIPDRHAKKLFVLE